MLNVVKVRLHNGDKNPRDLHCTLIVQRREIILPQAIEQLNLHQKPEVLNLRTVHQDVMRLQRPSVTPEVSALNKLAKRCWIDGAFTSENFLLYSPGLAGRFEAQQVTLTPCHQNIAACTSQQFHLSQTCSSILNANGNWMLFLTSTVIQRYATPLICKPDALPLHAPKESVLPSFRTTERNQENLLKIHSELIGTSTVMFLGTCPESLTH